LTWRITVSELPSLRTALLEPSIMTFFNNFLVVLGHPAFQRSFLELLTAICDHAALNETAKALERLSVLLDKPKAKDLMAAALVDFQLQVKQLYSLQVELSFKQQGGNIGKQVKQAVSEDALR